MDLKETAQKKINEISSSLKNEGCKISNIELKQYNYEFTFQHKGEKFKVQVYFGKKGLKIVLQGNQESEAYKELYNLIQDQPKLNFKSRELDEPDEYIGSDESGKGDYFGPLVVAAFYADKNIITDLIKMGVRDSKTISDYQIGILSKEINFRFKDNYETVTISPKKINELHSRFNNLNKILNWAHSTAIENLIHKTNCKIVITDKFQSKDLLIQQNNIMTNIDFVQTPKAERYTAVAAASIIARSTFNKWFDSQARKGFKLPKGASEIVDNKAKQILESSGKEVLEELAKLHFKTTRKISG